MNTAIACPHLAEKPQLKTDFVLDSHLNMTDAFVHCEECGATFLIELADMLGEINVFRISSLPPQAVASTVRSLTRGSCDITRARNEVFSVSSDSRELSELLVMVKGKLSGTVPRPQETILPRRSWRELPCDGSLIRATGLGD